MNGLEGELAAEHLARERDREVSEAAGGSAVLRGTASRGTAPGFVLLTPGRMPPRPFAAVQRVMRQLAVLIQWQMRRSAQTIPLIIVIQTMLAVATVIGYGLLIGSTERATGLYLKTGAPTISLVMLGLAMTPQWVAQERTEGSLDWMRTCPSRVWCSWRQTSRRGQRWRCRERSSASGLRGIDRWAWWSPGRASRRYPAVSVDSEGLPGPSAGVTGIAGPDDGGGRCLALGPSDLGELGADGRNGVGRH